MWLTMLSTAVLVVAIGSAVAMLVAAENRRAEERSPNRPNRHWQQAPSQGTGHVEDSRYFTELQWFAVTH